MKLVRDKIPELPNIRRRYRFQRLGSDEQYLKALKQKLIEESKEAKAAKSQDELISELVDITEIISQINRLTGVKAAEFESLRQKKLVERGGFKKRILLTNHSRSALNS